jgi:hypothetical protein
MDADHEATARLNKKKIISGQLIKEPVANLVADNPELIYDYERLKRNQQSYWLDKALPYETNGTRGVWIRGPPGTGKSHQAI